MARLRLQVQVLPWQDRATFPSEDAYNNTILKMPQCCLEGDTIETLLEKARERWGKTYAGYGLLNEKEVTTGHGEILNMDDIVGDFLDDRGMAKEVPMTSIVMVRRFPPTSSELLNLQRIQRFGSLMPESAARPRKHILHGALQGRQDRMESQTAQAQTQSDKRQRIQDAHPQNILNADRPMLSREGQVEGDRPFPRPNGQESVLHVMNSQRSPKKQHPNPYGTPTSLCLISPQHPTPADQLAVITIPDSPSSRGTQAANETFRENIFDVDRETTKSESPELSLSLDEVPSHEQNGALVEQQNGNVEGMSPRNNSSIVAVNQVNGNDAISQPLIVDLVAVSAPESKSIELPADEPLTTDNGGCCPKSGLSGVTSRPSLKRKQPPVDVALNEQVRRRKGGEIYDPIESDSDSFREKQRMHSIKRPRLNHIASGRFTYPHVVPVSSKISNDDDPSQRNIPFSHANRRRTSSGGPTAPSHEETATQRETGPSQESTLHTHQDKDLEQQRMTCSETSNSERSESPSQNNTTGLQGAEPTAKASQNSTKFKGLPEISSFEQGDDSETSNCMYGGQISDAVPHAQGVRSEELADVDESRASKVKDTKPTEAERFEETKAKEKELADQKKLAERQERARKARDRVLSDQAKKLALAADGARFLVAERLQKKKPLGTAKPNTAAIAATPKTLVFDPIVLAETKLVGAESIAADPELAMLSSATAKHIAPLKMTLNAESSAATVATEISLVSRLQCQDTASAEPKRRTYIPRTEEAKIRREELDGKRADQSKAAKQEKCSDGDHVHKKTQSNVNEAEERRESIKVNGAESIAMENHMNVPDQAAQKSTMNSDGRSRQSSAVSDVSSSAGHGRKSMTPALPRSSVTKSLCNQAEVISSSPLASRLTKDLETPLRSSLKQGSCVALRSVSFKDGLEDSPCPKTSKTPSPINKKPNTPRSKSFKSMLDINEEILSRTSIKPKSPEQTSANDKFGRKLARVPAGGKEMIQMKLNATGNVKGRGRATNPLMPAEPMATVRIRNSSSSSGDSLSSCLSDEEVVLNSVSKAGPSSRKPARLLESPSEIDAASLDPPAALIDPEIYTTRKEAETRTIPSRPSYSAPGSNTSSQPMLTSRSPARAMGGTRSISSENGDSGDEPGLRSASESDSCQESSSHQGAGSSDESSSSSPHESDKRLNGDMRSVNKNGFKVANVSPLSATSTNVAQRQHKTSAPASPSRGTTATNIPVKRINSTLNSQLQEVLQPVPPTLSSVPATGAASGEGKPATTTHPKLDRHGRLPNGTRPAYYRYPKLSELKKMAAAESIYDIPTSQNAAPTTTEDSESAKSSSDDEDSSSGNEETVGASQIISRSTPGRIPGLRGVIKLARLVRSVR